MKEIEVVCKVKDTMLPHYHSAGASGADIMAACDPEIVLSPGERTLVPTGLFLQIPEGFEAQIRPRSGLAFRQGLTVLNTPGTIDSDYRGEIKVILINLGREPVGIKKGDRIAQIVFMPVVRATFIPVREVGETERGEGGFGSTGI
ncbi:MAG: dUTP diphosphatase [Spirochaetales bacterium]|nr:dUTP diphosphatase [Spirochaetales bacterium]